MCEFFLLKATVLDIGYDERFASDADVVFGAFRSLRKA